MSASPRKSNTGSAFVPQIQLANVALVARESTRLTETWRTWPESFWQRPSYCPGWSAADVVAHLATGGDYYAQVISAGLEGVPRLPWGAATMEEYRAARTAAAQQLVEAGPQVLVASFEESAAHLQEILELLQDADLTKPAQMARATTPIGCMIHTRLSELTVHDWDIRQPYEPEARLSPTALSAVLTALQEMLVALLEPRLTDRLDGIHVFRTEEVSWALAVEGQTATYLAQAPATFNTCVQTDAESLILLTMGRANPETKLQSGTLAVKGNAEKGRRLCETLFRTL